MKTKEDIQKEIDNFEGDKRTLEYKELKKQLEEFDDNKSFIPTDVYNKVMSWNGRLPKEDYKWFFKTYNELFNARNKPCLCVGKIRSMVAKLTKTYEKENR